MTKIEENIIDALKRYWYGRERFGNTRVVRRGGDVRVVYIIAGNSEYPIFAKSRGGYFYSDPFKGKSKLVNSRLACLLGEFGGKEIEPEIMNAVSRANLAQLFWLGDRTYYEVKTTNNKTRFFKTEIAAKKYAGNKGRLTSF